MAATARAAKVKAMVEVGANGAGECTGRTMMGGGGEKGVGGEVGR
jgi:hypothetical protein